jgi:hypothetical protein
MKTVFDPSVRALFAKRICMLNESSAPQWGKMNVSQMLRHCILWDEMILRNIKYKRIFAGLLFGRLALKNEMNDQPMRKNNPSSPELVIKEMVGDVVTEKEKWIALISDYAGYSFPDYSFVHPFFGKMTREQIGYLAYKHTDHHLRQFGV